MSALTGLTGALSSYTTGSYGQKAGTAPTQSTASSGTGTTSTSTRSGDSATVLTLSEEAKAYLAAMTAAGKGAASGSAMARAQAARAWLDQEYKSLGIGSALVDGQVAVDFTAQDRATLAVVAAGTGDLFTADEKTAAASVLQARFEDALTPHAVIARHTGDYAGLYAAAADYLDAASPEERATAGWAARREAVTQGLAAARADFGKAPDTGDENDPVRAMLDAPAPGTSSGGKTATADTLAARARAALDAQAGRARDDGTELVFDGTRTGRMVDFEAFDNRTLAVVSQNADGQFSVSEARAARKALEQRTRTTLLSAFTGSGSDPAARSVALIRQYSSMSAEERAVLGFGESFTDNVLKNYRTVTSIQNMVDAMNASTGSLLGGGSL
ncbi:hypothetical protein PQJ75_05285 [Rhodoplanes sp. TEM]|uniref:Flagellar hook-associated protein 2 C-terminal domain-containing protein n=1 Tax=Rhodoplanes tepidamans TaxID=200616 RepID=A0ABT5JA16_RHOTP|nr:MULTISPECIES: hypothetical protein [Rhodoplanes]MDC7786526.1 hypothetical protein [Rhodoplanes tepidamans]MDC7983136.1 hypothetical protein [Rhodoplanes sp. TEM]MDQ0357594.1 hypothetical protein [Rhodoplanes tepidamans]